MTTTKTTIAIWISIILFGLVFGIGMVDVYAQAPVVTKNVEVRELPFNVTILEGGTVTVHNPRSVPYNYVVQNGWTAGSIQANSVGIISFPVSKGYTVDIYNLQDLGGYAHSTVRIVKPMTEQLTEQVSTQNTQVVDMSDIQKVPVYNGSVDVISIQEALTTVTTKFNNSIDVIAKQKAEIKNLKSDMVLVQTAKVDTTLLDNKILGLETANMKLSEEVTSITKDRDGWKKLAESWYGIAMEQLKVMVKVLGL